MAPNRIVIVDDDANVRRRLRNLLSGDPEFFIVAEASTGREAIDTVNRAFLDVLVLSLQLGDMPALNVLQKIGPNRQFKTLLLGANVQHEDEINAILLGAFGIVRKYAAPETILKSIRSVVDGQIWAERKLTAEVIAIMRKSNIPANNPAGPTRPSGLTARDLDIVRAVAQGLENREISETLGISVVTVKHYLNRIFSKVAVRNRVELALFAIRHGLASMASSHLGDPEDS
jgi:DNA-binding NarL/FixJ family response regulator